MIKGFADWLFRLYCNPDYYDDIQGDLQELYHRNAEKSLLRAQSKYFLQVLVLFRPAIIRSFQENPIVMNFSMLKNYLKTGSRNLIRQKLVTSINVVGLAVGLSAFILIDQYISFEKGYDTHFEKSEEIFRLGTMEVVNGEIDVKDANTTYALGRELSKELPEIKASTVTYHFDPIAFKNGKEAFYENNVVSGDSVFFDIFTYKMISGDNKSALSQPNRMVITRKKAIEWFGTTDCLNETIEVFGELNREFVISGIIEDVPISTHYYFDIVISDKSLVDREDYNTWNYNNYYTYLRVDPNFDRDHFMSMVSVVNKRHYGEDDESQIDIHPITDIYLTSDWTYEPDVFGDSRSVLILTIISFFIIIIAWINYINLSTARSLERAKEVGVRKAIGAPKSQLIFQFFTEALIVNFVAALLAFLLIYFLIPYFHLLTGKIIINNILNQSLLLSLLSFFALGTVISGAYPAIVLARFKPAVVLKGKVKNSRTSVDVRKVLVLFQFMASILLVAGTFIVNQQVDFMRNGDKGMITDFVVSFPIPEIYDEDSWNKVSTFKDELRASTLLPFVGSAGNPPGGSATDINSTTTPTSIIGLSEISHSTTYLSFIDDYLIPAMSMEIVAGRNFNREMPSDSSAVLLNESFLARANINDPEMVIGEQLRFGEGEDSDRFNIIGIVKDFNRTSMKAPIEATVYMPALNPTAVVVKLQEANYLEGLEYIDEKWAEFFPDEPLDYIFINDRFEKLYANDIRFGYVFLSFSVIAIIIATLGLFGLASYMASQRTKEIGVRKVLGASIGRIIMIFYREYVVLLTISALLSIPLVYFVLSAWLENYAFHISFPWPTTIISVVLVFVVALATVGYQTYKVAALSPSRTLKNE